MLVALEGIDGAGKTTQLHLLEERARRQGLRVASLSFPRYTETVFGRCVAAYLRGEFGPLAEVPPRSAALLFAGDRLESLELLSRLAAESDLLLLDRYVASNLAHQGARLAVSERDAFLAWLAHLEYEVFGLPRPALTLYLRLPVAVASSLLATRAQQRRSGARDLHEENAAYLARCAEVYEQLASAHADGPWEIVSCVDEKERLRSPEEIQVQVWSLLERYRTV
ncbi:MAG: dTMP kinase [Thermogemmatispora sp.]|uniref:dTMP kinase n=1 Tax=Thermogemmatispora sp. TaxID=1968838 RepID=UPI0019F23FF3|nr:dTMP kinase [Thermogemmatispora sp.]MBE3568035.1 dTMP kinase [Thermogemmatispora sp.]